MRGTICVEDEEVVIEMQVKLFNLFKRPPQSFRFDITDLEEVRHKRGVFHDAVTLRTRPMERVVEVPGSANGELCLMVKRARRDDVNHLLDRLDLWLTE